MTDFDTVTVRERTDGVKQVTVPSDLDVEAGDKLIVAPFDEYTVLEHDRLGELQYKESKLKEVVRDEAEGYDVC